MEGKYVVYENWQAENKAVVHKAECGHANESHERITNAWIHINFAPNGRWFGYFESLDSATAFAVLLPNRQLKYCGHCLWNEKEVI